MNSEILSINGASIFINHCSFGFNITCSFGKDDIDLFRKLKHDSHEFIIPANLSAFFIPKTKSVFS